MTMTALPTPPSTNDPTTFAAKADALLAALPNFVTEANALANGLNFPGLLATSTSSVAIGTGSKSFTIETGKTFVAGQSIMVQYTTTPTNWMYGTVTSYNSGTGALVVNVTSVLGSGTYAVWTVSLATPLVSSLGFSMSGGINTARGSVAMHATTMDLWAQPNIIDGTGSAVTVTAIANAPQAGAQRILYPIAGTVITHGATFSVAGNASYNTAAGDALVFTAITTSTYDVGIIKQDGTQAIPFYGAISGFVLSSLAGTNTTASGSISAGQATSLLGSTAQTAQILKSSASSWAVSNGNAINGYEGGTTLPNSSTIHMYMCSGASGTGCFASTSLTPTFPTGYAVSARRVGSFKTNGSGAPLAFISYEMAGGGVKNTLSASVLDVDVTNPGSAAVTRTLSVPAGIAVEAFGNSWQFDSTASNGTFLTDLAVTDEAPSSTVAPLANMYAALGANGQAAMVWTVRTNTSSQIRSRMLTSNASTILRIATLGWIDHRRN